MQYLDLAGQHYDVAVVDLELGRVSGLDVLRILKLYSRSTRVVLMASSPTVELTVEALHLGAAELLTKPFPLERFRAVLNTVAELDDPAPHALAARLDRHLAENCGTPHLRVTALCRRFHISASYISKLFSQHLGMSFPQRLRYHRIRHAKELICRDELTLKEIAVQCGFSNQSQLSKAFHCLEGNAPKAYRRQ